MARRRDTSEFLRQMRELLLGRKPVGHSRFQPDLAPRTQDPPEIPGGAASSKISQNYYYPRDARRCVEKPTIIFDSMKPMVKSKPESAKKEAPKKEPPKTEPAKKPPPKDVFFPCSKTDTKGSSKTGTQQNKSAPSKKSNLPTPGPFYKY